MVQMPVKDEFGAMFWKSWCQLHRLGKVYLRLWSGMMLNWCRGGLNNAFVTVVFIQDTDGPENTRSNLVLRDCFWNNFNNCVRFASHYANAQFFQSGLCSESFSVSEAKKGAQEWASSDCSSFSRQQRSSYFVYCLKSNHLEAEDVKTAADALKANWEESRGKYIYPGESNSYKKCSPKSQSYFTTVSSLIRNSKTHKLD